jgi:hypothetical protein
MLYLFIFLCYPSSNNLHLICVDGEPSNQKLDTISKEQRQGPSIRKQMTVLFFVYFGTHNNKIHTIYKQTSVFVLIFFMLLFCFY